MLLVGLLCSLNLRGVNLNRMKKYEVSLPALSGSLFWSESSISPSISSTFYEQLLRQYPCAKNLQSQTASTKSFWHKNIGAKAAHKMLMKLTLSWTRLEGHPHLPPA